MPADTVEDLLRQLAPQVLGALVRRYGHFDDGRGRGPGGAARRRRRSGRPRACPDNPRAWLITVAARRLTDLLRSDQARRRREDDVATWILPDQWLAPAADRPDRDGTSEQDDTLEAALPFAAIPTTVAPVRPSP